MTSTKWPRKRSTVVFVAILRLYHHYLLRTIVAKITKNSTTYSALTFELCKYRKFACMQIELNCSLLPRRDHNTWSLRPPETRLLHSATWVCFMLFPTAKLPFRKVKLFLPVTLYATLYAILPHFLSSPIWVFKACAQLRIVRANQTKSFFDHFAPLDHHDQNIWSGKQFASIKQQWTGTHWTMTITKPNGLMIGAPNLIDRSFDQRR